MSEESDERKPHARANEPDELVVVYRAMGLLRAEVIRGRLESAGIPAMLKYESASSAFPVVGGAMGEVQVLVTKSREQEALELLDEPPETE